MNWLLIINYTIVLQLKYNQCIPKGTIGSTNYINPPESYDEINEKRSCLILLSSTTFPIANQFV